MARRLALIIGNSIFRDPSLARLLTPDADVGALADVLLNPEIGAFDDVKLVVNMAAASIRRSISQFFANKTRDDLLLLYFSGHGVLDENGRLYLATKETERSYLRGTAIPAAFITDEMDHSRSHRQVLVLDCCHSGAFARGTKGAPGASVGTATAFEGKGYGRVVLTASDATQYAWEGDQVIGEAVNSLFTHYLVQGLHTGEADTDADGTVTVDELYDYVYARVISQTPNQTPGKWSYKEQGEIVLARAPTGAPPPPERIDLPEFDDEIEAKLKRMYDTGLAAYWLDDWDRAARAFQAILDARPDYPGALDKLRESRRNAELARLYQTAQDALASQDWDAAVSALEALLAQAPDYRDAASQLQAARQHARLAALYAEARRLGQAEEWYAARRVLANIAAIDPEYPDPDGLQAAIDENIAALEHRKKLDDLYSQALAKIDAQSLEDARDLLSQVQTLEPGYEETGPLLAKVESLQRQAEQRQRREQVDDLYQQAKTLARAKKWPEVLAKLDALLHISPDFDDPDDLLATARRQVEQAQETSKSQAAAPTPTSPPPARQPIWPQSRPEPAEPARLAPPWYSQSLSLLRAHPWLSVSTSILIVMLVLFLDMVNSPPAIYEPTEYHPPGEAPAAIEAPAATPDATAPLPAISARTASVQTAVASQTAAAETLVASEMAAASQTAAAQTAEAFGRIAFVSDRDGNPEIYLMNADGSDQTRLTNNTAQDFDPAWSPDGTRIAFGSWRDSSSEIYVVNVDGSGQTRLTNDSVNDFDPNWSPDGTRIAFESIEIYVMNADGSEQTRLTDTSGSDFDPAWSPDGTRIAFVSGRDLTWEIYVMNPDGSGQTRLTGNLAIDTQPAWSPDGTRIIFYSEPEGNGEIYVMNADGSKQTWLTNNPASDWDPAWSPDGTRIAFTSNRHGNPEIYVMNADGSEQTRLTNDSADDRDPAWSPDGARIAFVSERDDNSEIYVMNADGSEQIRLTNNPGSDLVPAWQP